MNMVAMNVPTGGPVGGGMVMMNNNGVGTPSNNNATQENMKVRLNTYVYEYLLKLGHFDLARALHKEEKFEMILKDPIKQSPGRRKDANMNGDSMDMDSNEDIPDDLPRPALQADSPGHGFLFDWFCLFHDMFNAQRQKPGQGDNNVARQYINQTQNLQRMRETQQNSKLPGNGMMANNQQQMMRNMRNNPMMNGELQRAAMAKSMTPQQIQALQTQQRMQVAQQQQQMQREHSDMGMNGQRPGTPADGENGGSPSKRPRLGDQQFTGGMVPNGRGQGMPNVSQGMLMQSGFNPNNINQAQFTRNGAMQQKAMQGPMPNGMNMMGNTGSPLMQPMDQNFANGMGMDGLGGYRMPGNGGMPGNPAAQSGNHALQDYQMQLMLLEQQNKKRLMMARQEQDNITRGDGGPMPGQIGMQPSGMSPSSRTGTSPNPGDQMKRGTPQMGVPGSPSAGDLQGRSPMNFMQGMQPDFNPQMFINQKEGLVPGGPGMRPPNGDINALRAQQGNRMAGPFPPGQQMVQNPSQGQPQPMGTPGQRNNEMPPPQAPATGGSAQRAQPSSPNSGGAPPTPSQTNKANPKGKKGKEGETAGPRKRPNKKNSQTNAAASEEPPATPTPSTPITPQHPSSFNSGGKGPGAANANPAPTSNPVAQPVPPQMAQPDLSQSDFGNFDGGGENQTFNLDFSTLENPDVLENFDFDSFLNQSADDGSFMDNAFGGDAVFGMDNVD